MMYRCKICSEHYLSTESLQDHQFASHTQEALEAFGITKQTVKVSQDWQTHSNESKAEILHSLGYTPSDIQTLISLEFYQFGSKVKKEIGEVLNKSTPVKQRAQAVESDENKTYQNMYDSYLQARSAQIKRPFQDGATEAKASEYNNPNIEWTGDDYHTSEWSCKICGETGDNLNFGATISNIEDHLKTHGIGEAKASEEASEDCPKCGHGKNTHSSPASGDTICYGSSDCTCAMTFPTEGESKASEKEELLSDIIAKINKKYGGDEEQEEEGESKSSEYYGQNEPDKLLFTIRCEKCHDVIRDEDDIEVKRKAHDHLIDQHEYTWLPTERKFKHDEQNRIYQNMISNMEYSKANYSDSIWNESKASEIGYNPSTGVTTSIHGGTWDTDEEEAIARAELNPTNKCGMCNKTFDSVQELKDHLRASGVHYPTGESKASEKEDPMHYKRSGGWNILDKDQNNTGSWYAKGDLVNARKEADRIDGYVADDETGSFVYTSWLKNDIPSWFVIESKASEAISEDEKDEIFQYLFDLQESGATNMFGSGAYVERDFPHLDKKVIDDVIQEWMSNWDSIAKRMGIENIPMEGNFIDGNTKQGKDRQGDADFGSGNRDQGYTTDLDFKDSDGKYASHTKKDRTSRNSIGDEGFDQGGIIGWVDAKCKTCGVEFNSPQMMDAHYRDNRDHESNLGDLHDESDLSMWTESLLGESLKSHTDYHKLVNSTLSGETSIQCSKCTKKFKGQESLNIHYNDSHADNELKSLVGELNSGEGHWVNSNPFDLTSDMEYVEDEDYEVTPAPKPEPEQKEDGEAMVEDIVHKTESGVDITHPQDEWCELCDKPTTSFEVSDDDYDEKVEDLMKDEGVDEITDFDEEEKKDFFDDVDDIKTTDDEQTEDGEAVGLSNNWDDDEKRMDGDAPQVEDNPYKDYYIEDARDQMQNDIKSLSNPYDLTTDIEGKPWQKRGESLTEEQELQQARESLAPLNKLDDEKSNVTKAFESGASAEDIYSKVGDTTQDRGSEDDLTDIYNKVDVKLNLEKV